MNRLAVGSVWQSRYLLSHTVSNRNGFIGTIPVNLDTHTTHNTDG